MLPLLLAFALVWPLLASTGVVPSRWAGLLLLAPWAEEVLFRAGLQRWLDGRGGWAARHAVGLTALAFAAAHVLVSADARAAATLLPALALGWVYARTGRLALCVAWHATFNAAWLAAQHGSFA